MPHKLTRNANHVVEVKAHLERSVVDSERRNVIRKLTRTARVPGFRPGRAPEVAVKARYAEEIREELREHLAALLWREVLDSEDNLHPLTPPEFSAVDFDDDGGFQIAARVEARPVFALPELAEVTLPDYALDVSASEIDEELERLREENATWEPADEEAAQDGLLVEADLRGAMEDSEDKSYSEDGARFILGSEAVPKEINEALQGVRVGEERVATRRFPDDDPNRDRAGKTVTYTIAVRALKGKVLPDVDDELAEASGFDTLDALRERIAEVIARRKMAERRERWRRFLLDHLEQGLDINDLPSSLVQEAVRQDLNRFAYSMAMQGLAPDSADVDWQELAAKLEPGSRRRVLDTLILEQLAREWEIDVPEHEVDAYIRSQAERLGIPPGEHKANLAKEDKLDALRHAARLAATESALIARAGGEVAV
jgi:trigger factor